MATSSGSIPAVFCSNGGMQSVVEPKRRLKEKEVEKVEYYNYLKASQVHNEFMSNCSIDTTEKNRVVVLKTQFNNQKRKMRKLRL